MTDDNLFIDPNKVNPRPSLIGNNVECQQVNDDDDCEILDIVNKWSKKEQQSYLKDKNLPITGLKRDLVPRIIANMDIEYASKLVTEAKNKQQQKNKGTKRKRDT